MLINLMNDFLKNDMKVLIQASISMNQNQMLLMKNIMFMKTYTSEYWEIKDKYLLADILKTEKMLS